MGALKSKSCGSKDAKKGQEWTYKLYFEPEADINTGKSHTISIFELLDELSNLVNVGEPIINIWAYKQDLFRWQLTRLILFHIFIVFETNDWWWSIEKNSEGITIQRSTKHEAVKEMYRGVERNKCTLMLADKGNKTMEELIVWLAGVERNENGVILLSGIGCLTQDMYAWLADIPYVECMSYTLKKGRSIREIIYFMLNKENQLKKKYNYISSNCQHFAKDVFNYVAATIKM